MKIAFTFIDGYIYFYPHLSVFSAKAKFLDKRTGFSRQELVELLYVTYPSDRFDKYEGFHTLCVEKIESNEYIEIADANLFRNGNYINSLEDTSICLNIMTQLQRIFPSLLPSKEEIYDYQTSYGIKLTEALLKHYSSIKETPKKKQKRRRDKA